MQPSYTPEQIEQIRRSNNKKLLWGIVCLVGPTMLLILGVQGYAIANFMFGGLSGDDSAARPFVNILLFLIGIVSILTWLPGIIGGIILLAKRQHI